MTSSWFWSSTTRQCGACPDWRNTGMSSRPCHEQRYRLQLASLPRQYPVDVIDLERKKLADARRPRPARASTAGSRHVPAAVRREVWTRDAGWCAFVGNERRCTERGFLELHHVVPFADGGPTTAENIQLRCRAHNVYEAEQHFGPLFVREEKCSFRDEPRSMGEERSDGDG
jgi:hypothetical protein